MEAIKRAGVLIKNTLLRLREDRSPYVTQIPGEGLIFWHFPRARGKSDGFGLTEEYLEGRIRSGSQLMIQDLSGADIEATYIRPGDIFREGRNGVHYFSRDSEVFTANPTRWTLMRSDSLQPVSEQ